MTTASSRSNGRIAAERQRKVYEFALQRGAVNATEAARALGVTAATIRRDLDVLASEGKLIRSHGGAVVKDRPAIRPPYTETRNANPEEKAWIARAAIHLLPASGSIFLAGGTTTYQLALRIPPERGLQVVTTSPEIALHLVTSRSASVHLLGGVMRPDSLTTNCLNDPALDMLYWDVTFFSVPALDISRGLTTIDQEGALCLKRIIERGNKTVVLCDSSKLGCYSHARIGPVGLADVLITDRRASREMVDALKEEGLEVIVAGQKSEGLQGWAPDDGACGAD